ncbi:MAG: hypothetical protein IT190_02115 [Microbacteriaceae bacterium]|nr:hypothetical protein [Microbacteriaceae bacterium]
MESDDSSIDERPLYGQRRTRFIRTVVFIAVGAMMLPILASLYSVTAASAARACIVATINEAPDATGTTAPFEIFGPGLFGWECYATGTFGGTRHIISLGLLPGLVTLPSGGVRT